MSSITPATSATQSPVSNRVSRPKDTAARLGIGLSTYWYLVKNDPDFPRPFKLGVRTTVNYDSEVDAYVAARAAKCRIAA